METRTDLPKTKIIVILSGSFLLGIIIIALFNLSSKLPVQDAEKRIKLILARQVTQLYLDPGTHKMPGNMDAETGKRYGEELKSIRELKFSSIKVRKLIPDYILMPHRPTHIVQAELLTEGYQHPPRYFWLSWSGIDREISRVAWYFSL
jgi:hypothetical protein